MASFQTPPNLTTTQVLSGDDQGIVAAGSSVTVTSARAIQIDLAPSPLGAGIVIDNAGTISSTGAGRRAIDTTNAPTDTRTISILNRDGGTITSQNDAIRIDEDLLTGSSVTLDNSGTISTTGTGSNGGQAIDFNAIATSGSSITIINRASGVITSADADAVRPGQAGVVQNAGQITANALAVPGDQPSADGIDFQDGKTGTVRNFSTGIISGAKGGVAGGVNTSVDVTNDAGGQIIGRNGAGVGLDGTGTVLNYGTIRGTVDATSARGDGDGVDIDFAGSVTNYGTIEGLGAKGNDSGGRANAGEGVSIGGGTVTNYGTIRSAATNPDGQTVNTGGAIIVNNDAMTNRSGVQATTITNFVNGSIIGGSTFAIRLENKDNAAISADTITNYGTITGNGTVPDPSAIVTIPAGAIPGSADPNSVGTLDGVAYTGTGSARFIRGDGAAIQMGEGIDRLENYGTITGNSGRAINLEGGNDLLILHTGSTITGRIDGGSDIGGADLDTLRLALDDRNAANVSTQGANSGTTAGTLANVINFEVLDVDGGQWTLTDAQTYRGGINVASGASLIVASTGALTGAVATNGTLSIDGTLTGAVAVAAGGTLGGSGTTGAVTVASGGFLSPAGSALGVLNTGDLSLANGATYVEQIGGATAGAGYDQTKVTGTVNLNSGGNVAGGATLSATFANGFTPTAGQSYVIIDNDGTNDAVVGTFSGLAEGATVAVNGVNLVISYRGGDGNDVTLTDPAPSNPPAPAGPTAVSDTASATFGRVLTATAPGVLANDSGSGGTLTVTAVNGQTAAVGKAVAGVYGNLALNGDGSYTYTPDATKTVFTTSVVDHFTYTDTANGQTATANLDITVSAPPASTLALFGTVVTNSASQTGSVYALYEGLLGRAPDALGLEGFSASLQAGAKLTDVAAAILNSAERGGLVSDPNAYVQALYTNTLHRAPDSAGQQFYINELNSGVSQATVAVQFASSTEAAQVNAPAFSTGVFVTDAIDAAVARLYYGLLDRSPDATGLGGFEMQVKQAAATGGVNGAIQGLANVANGILGSQEYAATHTGQSNAEFVDSLFVGALGRHADAGGSTFFTNELAQGVSQAQVALQIAQSQEAQVHLAGQIELGWHLA